MGEKVKNEGDQCLLVCLHFTSFKLKVLCPETPQSQGNWGGWSTPKLITWENMSLAMAFIERKEIEGAS